MIQFNLLPEVKIEYIKSQRIKRLVTVVSVIVSGVSIFIIVSLFLLINIAQKQHLNNLSEDITTKSKKLQNVDDISRILTVQNQLLSLHQAHDKKPVVSRLGGFIETITPSNVSISKISVSFKEGTMIVSGKTDQLANVNKFVDTIKFTKFKIVSPATDSGGTPEVISEDNAFSSVVLTEFSKAESGATTYSIALAFNTAIFDQQNYEVKDGKVTKEVVLSVPNITTNRSATEKPTALFEAAPKNPGEEN